MYSLPDHDIEHDRRFNVTPQAHDVSNNENDSLYQFDHIVGKKGLNLVQTITPPSSSMNSPSQMDPPDQHERPSSAVSRSDSFSSESDTSGAPMHRLNRSASILSLSRTSFAAQISRLTSLSMPLSSDLKKEILSMPSSMAAIDKLKTSYPQIQRWIQTAKAVLQDLDAEDNVEWAAQGKVSLDEVDTAISQFGTLVQVYIACIEEIQRRDDIRKQKPTVLKGIVSQMELTIDEWRDVQTLLRGVKTQVETALEWKELWITILHEIQAELDACQTIIFQMEERRHQLDQPIDIDSLNGIIDDRRFSVASSLAKSPNQPDDASSLLGLFARMQPLRASLDFLPMRIASFRSRAESMFPSAFDELDSKRKSLEKKWGQLEADAEALKKELGEDKWIDIFRNAGKQATKMMASVQRSTEKIMAGTIGKEPIEGGLAKSVESYEAKKLHYGPAIERVLAIIDKGIQDRLTVNGEILRLHNDLDSHWKTLQTEIGIIDRLIMDYDVSTPQESIASILSGFESDGTSPASSVIMSELRTPNNKQHYDPKTPAPGSKIPRLASRPGSAAGHHHHPQMKITSSPNAPITPPSTIRPTMSHRVSNMSNAASLLSPTASSRGSSPSSSRRLSYQTPPSSTRSQIAPNKSTSSYVNGKPRWNSSTNTEGNGFGHNFPPLATTTPSVHSREYRPGPAAASSKYSYNTSPLSTRSGAVSPTLSTTSTFSSSRRAAPTIRTRASHDNFGASLRSPTSTHSATRRPASAMSGALKRASARLSTGAYTSTGVPIPSTTTTRPTLSNRSSMSNLGAAAAGTGSRRNSIVLANGEKPRWRF